MLVGNTLTVSWSEVRYTAMVYGAIGLFHYLLTSSVAIAGVLLVFCYLIIPSVGAMLYADRVAALVFIFRLQIDLPMGATIVCTFGIILVLMASVRGLLRRTLA
jgi:zinc/manganese transport system permease protein